MKKGKYTFYHMQNIVCYRKNIYKKGGRTAKWRSSKYKSGQRGRIMTIVTYTCMRNLDLKANIEMWNFESQNMTHTQKN